jgi:hypothetical protein
MSSPDAPTIWPILVFFVLIVTLDAVVFSGLQSVSDFLSHAQFANTVYDLV